MQKRELRDVWGVCGITSSVDQINKRCWQMVDRSNATLVVSGVLGVTFADGKVY